MTGSKRVKSTTAGRALRDMTPDLSRHRTRDAGPTVPPGGWPATVGADPDAKKGIAPSARWTTAVGDVGGPADY